MSTVGEAIANHRGLCVVSVMIEYSCPDLLLPGDEVYAGPRSSRRREGSMRRLEWYAKYLPLTCGAPYTGTDARALGAEVGEAVTLQLFRDPPATMLLTKTR